jgi:hypothetical protein
MTSSAWREALLVLCAICTLAFVANVASGTFTASDGLDFHVAASGTPFAGRIEGVESRSPAASAGLRNGDLVPFQRLDPEVRYRLLSGVYAHERLNLVVVRDGVSHAIAYTSGPAVPLRWDYILLHVSVVWQLLFAILLAWRRPELPEARALCIFMSTNWLAGYFLPGSWASPWVLLDVTLAVISYVVPAVSAALLTYYASLFARPPSRLRRVLTILSYALACAGALASTYVFLGTTYGTIDPLGANSWASVVSGLWGMLPLCALLAAVGASHGPDRGRIAWTTLSLLPLLFAGIPYVIAVGVLGNTNTSSAWDQLTNVGVFLYPIGISYALLNRRLLDVSFALNRAAVFTGVSIVVIGAFVLTEYVLSEWLGAGRNANLLAGAVLALLLGFSMRYIHARVDHVLDNLFFKKRHEDEQAIREFAHEVAFITDPEIVLERIVRVLEQRADAAWCYVEIADERNNYGAAGENDPAIVSLRATHKRVDLHALDSALRGEFAYPMISRARLVGVLVLGPKHSGQPYAPDESDAIAHLAHGAGLALDTLSRGSTERNDVLEAIRTSNDRVIAAIHELRDFLKASSTN